MHVGLLKLLFARTEKEVEVETKENFGVIIMQALSIIQKLMYLSTKYNVSIFIRNF